MRRARVWDEYAERWNYIKPGQSWSDGDVTAPPELEQCRNERELLRALQVRSAQWLNLRHPGAGKHGKSGGMLGPEDVVW